jgi:Flp pilus assembly protein TadD
LLRARGYFDLGAYLRAARVLRRLYLSDPADAEVWTAYAEALTWARLDSDAEDVATHGAGPDKAAAYVASLREKLSPHTAHLPAVHGGTRWWTDSAGD